jgi:PAS domain-containing protein
VLYAGVALFVGLAAFTARAIWTAWHERSGEARAEALFDLVGQRMPPRPTEAPGAMAWLQRELERYARHLDDDRARLYRQFASASDGVPAALEPVRDAIRRATVDPAAPGRVRWLGISDPAGPSSLRSQRLVVLDSRTFVVTRRRALEPASEAGAVSSDSVVRWAAAFLGEASASVERELIARQLPAVPGNRQPHPVRLYLVSEDGTLISAPWEPARNGSPDDGRSPEADGPASAAERELALLSARPGLPTFAPEEFFFRGGASRQPDGGPGQSAYSGFYLDLGGRGLVSTITQPVIAPNGQHGVAALDLAFEIDWQRFAASVDAPMTGAAVRVPDGGAATWTAFDAALPREASPALRAATATLASAHRQATALDEMSPVRHALVDRSGALAAFQVSEATWLLMLFPQTAPAFPVAAVVALAGLLALLLAGFELNRRRAEGERQRSQQALAEKQNLLNTMQVPLVVVDPNTDAIVSSNRAAETIGIQAGTRFADLVWPDDRARAHYQKMQAAGPQPRRAYGVPVAVRDERGEVHQRYAIVRSVAVTAPIEALAADERHRLGVLFVLEPDADLALLAEDLERAAHRDERRRLAGLLSHGVATLARVLEHCLSQPQTDPETRELTAWLAEYLERRLTVASWLLDHWDASPPLDPDSIVDAEQCRVTVARFEAIFKRVRDDRELRARLHWDNGTLAAGSPDGRVLETCIDWPESFEIICPVRGGFGLFVSEVLANAVRHGRPGTVPVVTIRGDRVRKEIAFRVENESSAAAAEPRGEAYGGMAILRRLGRLFEWRDMTFAHAGGKFVAEWRAPASERGAAGQAD